MERNRKQAVVVALGRSAFGRSQGSLKYTRPEDLCAQVVRGVLENIPVEVRGQIEDFVLGCSTPECEQGLNMARIVVPLAGLPESVTGQTVNRFCSSGLQAIATAANTIISGQQKIVLAGGVESMSCVPMIGARYLPSPDLLDQNSNYHITMGVTAEIVAERYGVTRERMDAFAAASHQKAAAAREAGKFKDDIIPVMAVAPADGSGEIRRIRFDTDEALRLDTTPERLANLRTLFKQDGTVTAGNSSQVSDGASVALLMEEETAREMNLKPLARFVTFAVAGVRPEVMGIGPVEAIPKALDLAGLTLKDIDLIELNEAFASQSLACMDELALDSDKVNVNGGAIAMGHPLGCTGTALTVKVINELRRRGGRYGMVTMCVGGGQGAAGIFELL